jgi:hypothetical protein
MLTIVTPADKFDLVDVNTARTALGLTDQSDDAALAGFITRASDVIARYCRRVFAKEAVREQFRLNRLCEELILSRYPISEVASIVEGDNTLVPTDYECDLAKGIVTRLSDDRPCYWPPRVVAVTYSSGFDLPRATPPALAQACVQLVKSYYLGADRDPAVRSESVSDVSDASYFSDALPPEIAGLCASFRNYRIT